MKLLGLFIGGMLLVGCSGGAEPVNNTDVERQVTCIVDPANPAPNIYMDPDGNTLINNWNYISDKFYVTGKSKEQMIKNTFVQKPAIRDSVSKSEDILFDDGGKAYLSACDATAKNPDGTPLVKDNGPTPAGVGPMFGTYWEYVE